MAGTTVEAGKYEYSMLQDVLRQEGDHIRKIAIGLKNSSKCLLNNPCVYYESGGSDTPLPAEIQGGHVGLLGARKISAALTGTSGVITYNIANRNATLALMWSVPMDFNVFSSWWNVKVFDGKREANAELFSELYSQSSHPYKGNGEWYEGIAHNEWQFRGMMTDSNCPVLEVELIDRTSK